LRLVPFRPIDAVNAIETLIEFHDRQKWQTTKFGHENFSQIRGASFPNPGADAFQTHQSMYVSLPQHPFPR
jgi:hypothetical protein